VRSARWDAHSTQLWRAWVSHSSPSTVRRTGWQWPRSESSWSAGTRVLTLNDGRPKAGLSSTSVEQEWPVGGMILSATGRFTTRRRCPIETGACSPASRSLEPLYDRHLEGLTLVAKAELGHQPCSNHAEVAIPPLGDGRKRKAARLRQE
jgi:hypothetical protein